ncbi:Scr1 family TA system antitoxin-like transcriptional regulator [Nonomuraea insulae]|uniref:Scr1 family TA system antitoxin-like transcriptional regulator n=1 Tax=Nonomuraea insulae TaxID=1616787 RepID=A0ABW1D7P1_9ACTN
MGRRSPKPRPEGASQGRFAREGSGVLLWRLRRTQLGHLLSVSVLPSISLGIIPLGADRSTIWPTEGFFMFDDAEVTVELVSGHLTVTRPHEIGMYAGAFTDLAGLAVYGKSARTLIRSALAALDE